MGPSPFDHGAWLLVATYQGQDVPRLCGPAIEKLKEYLIGAT
jgi:hypothetical protein